MNWITCSAVISYLVILAFIWLLGGWPIALLASLCGFTSFMFCFGVEFHHEIKEQSYVQA